MLMNCHWTANIQPRGSQHNTLSLGPILGHLFALRCREETAYCHPSPWPSSMTWAVPVIGLQSSHVPPRTRSEHRHKPSGWQEELACQWHDGTTSNHMAAEDVRHLSGSEATMCKRVQFPSWTAHAASPKPAPPSELLERSKIKPNSLLCSHVHVTHADVQLLSLSEDQVTGENF